jgi:signal transduction histidine kinase
MGIWQNKKLPVFFKRRGFVYSVAFLVLVVVLLGYTLIIFRQNSTTVNRFNQQITGIAKTSTAYLASNYELYGSPITIKFQNIVKDFLYENIEVKSFSIFDTTGKVIYDSSSSLIGQVETGWLDESRKDTITAVKKDGRIQVLISPYFEEWGSHQYSVLFYPSYSEVDKENWQFSIELGLITILSVAIIAAIALLLTFLERNKLHREEKQKLENIDKLRREFLLLVAHHLRTPITIIQGYISLLQELDISAEQKAMIEPVTETVHHFYLLIEQILTITDLLDQDSVSISKQDVTLASVIGEIINDNQTKITEMGLVVTQAFKPENAVTFSNERYLKMVFTFLIENAIKFNKSKGKIDIAAITKDNFVEISIADTGIGIAKPEQNKIFGTFHKSDPHQSVYDFNYTGLGLGLYTAKILVDALGGKIWFDSQEGVGTTFYIDLPIQPK